MTKRSAKDYPRDPHNWYIEPRQPVAALARLNNPDGSPFFGNDLIYDPCCGTGNILDIFKEHGFCTVGSDIIDRHARHRFIRGNFLKLKNTPHMPGRALSIVSNPPYGKQDGFESIGFEIIKRAMEVAPFRRAAFLLPIEFLCGQERFGFFTRTPPSHVAYCSQRPSMPPGAMVEDMGPAAFTGGMADYCWIIWTAPHRWKTQSIWLRPE